MQQDSVHSMCTMCTVSYKDEKGKHCVFMIPSE